MVDKKDHALRRRGSIELGSVESSRISHLLELEDLLILPGHPDDFKCFRFAFKLTEFSHRAN